jgi:SAM-dependent methyltransferase
MLKDKILKILSCPFHPLNDLSYDASKKRLLCKECGKTFEVLDFRGAQIPNFLIAPHDWNKKGKKLDNMLLNRIQGRPFERKIEEGRDVLDIGCGENPRGNINLDCYIPESVPKNFILADAEHLPFKGESIDIVLSNFSIEHMVNPAIFIQKIFNIAKEKVEIVTDNSEWLGDVFFRILGSGRIFNDEHCYKWSVEYLENLLKKAGIVNSRVYLTNLSTNRLVKLFSLLGYIPRFGNFFYRDLKAVIWKFGVRL